MADNPRFTWDAQLGRFRYAASGRLVPTANIRNAIDTALRNQQARARALGEALREGRIGTAEWELSMRRMVKDSHLYTSAAARGGFEQMTAADFGRAGGHIGREYAYLRRFREGLEDGTRTMDGRGLADAQSYAEAARRTYHDAERQTRQESAGERGARLLVTNVLNPADHCQECQDLTDAGAMDPDEMPSPGDRECGNGCKCDLVYEEVEGAGTEVGAGE
jgi:hypothetical protein